jgi:uncharacterized phage-associated protein
MSTQNDVTFSHHLSVTAVAEYLVQQDALRDESDVTPMKLQKLLYLAQANYLASTGERLFDENVEAYLHGPVVHRAWQLFPGRQIIAESGQANYASNPQERIPEDAEVFLDAIWSKYSDFSAVQLRKLTHEQAPWKDHYDAAAHRPIIPDDDMASFFRHSVPIADRVYHGSVVIMPPGFVNEIDEDAMAKELSFFLNS